MDHKAVAARIVAEPIRQLKELEEMASDPYLFDFMCRIVDASRNGHAKTVVVETKIFPARTTPSPSVSRPHNGLTEAVLKACQEMKSKITIAKVTQQLTDGGFKFVSKKPKVAVADVMGRYTDKKLKVTVHGEGNEPNVYKWIEEAENAKT